MNLGEPGARTRRVETSGGFLFFENVSALRQTAAFVWPMELSGSLPKIATPGIDFNAGGQSIFNSRPARRSVMLAA